MSLGPFSPLRCGNWSFKEPHIHEGTTKALKPLSLLQGSRDLNNHWPHFMALMRRRLANKLGKAQADPYHDMDHSKQIFPHYFLLSCSFGYNDDIS